MTPSTGRSESTGSPASPGLYVALPVLDEEATLERLLECLSHQAGCSFRLVACVNQPDDWWTDPDRVRICESNARSIRLLKSIRDFPVEVIDRSSRGQGWKGRRLGVGYARKAVMDRILEVAGPDDIIVSLDADTVFGPCYLASVADNLHRHKGVAALAAPYFHRLPSDEQAARAILRYEIYMRHYFLNLHRIGSPYAFTALGSAMAMPVRAVRAIGGMTPKLSGEDFYFLQKLRKYGEVLIHNEELVYPEARFSDRVFFGTGPAMIKGAAGDWSSYPVYPQRFFNEILGIYRLIPDLFDGPADSRVFRFMQEIFREEDPCGPLRENHRTPERFARAFHEKFDGLRILQYLKMRYDEEPEPAEKSLFAGISDSGINEWPGFTETDIQTFSFESSPVEVLDAVRISLFEREQQVRLSSARG